MWDYLSLIYEEAEGRSRKSTVLAAFRALKRATTDTRIGSQFNGSALCLPRRAAYEIVREIILSPESNLLNETRPMHNVLRTFAGSPDRVKLAGCTHGVPMIGFTKADVWFGTTPYPHLWIHPAEVRAAALERPLLEFPEFLAPRWSPASPDWQPRLWNDTNWDADRQTVSVEARVRIVTGLFASIATLTPLSNAHPLDGFALTSTLAGTPDLIWLAQTRDDVMRSLAATENYARARVVRGVVVVTNMAPRDFAAEIHSFQVQGELRPQFYFLPDESLLRHARHLPWLLNDHNDDFVPGIVDGPIGRQLRAICMLETFRYLRPFQPSPDMLRRCWRQVAGGDDFEVVSDHLIRAGILQLSDSSWRLTVPPFYHFLPADSPFTALSDVAEDFFLALPNTHRERLDMRKWIDGAERLSLRYLLGGPVDMRRKRPYRSVHVLDTILDLDPADWGNRYFYALDHLYRWDIGVAKSEFRAMLQEQQITREEVADHVVTAVVQALRRDELHRIDELLGWVEVIPDIRVATGNVLEAAENFDDAWERVTELVREVDAPAGLKGLQASVFRDELRQRAMADSSRLRRGERF